MISIWVIVSCFCSICWINFPYYKQKKRNVSQLIGHNREYSPGWRPRWKWPWAYYTSNQPMLSLSLQYNILYIIPATNPSLCNIIYNTVGVLYMKYHFVWRPRWKWSWAYYPPPTSPFHQIPPRFVFPFDTNAKYSSLKSILIKRIQKSFYNMCKPENPPC